MAHAPGGGAAAHKLRFLLIAAVAAGLAIGLPGPRARAAVLCVNPGGTGGCFSSIQAAVNAAGNGDTISVAPGIYAEDVVIAGSATVPTTKAVTIAGAPGTILEGGGSRRVVEIAIGSALTLSGVTIQNGLAIPSMYGHTHGGGIHNHGQLTLTNSAIRNNAAPIDNGGGIYNAAGASATLTNVTISGNTSGVRGGGVYNGGTMTLSNVTLGNNSAPTGGGILNAGTLTLRNTIVANSPAGGNCSGTLTSLGHNLSSDTTCTASFAQVGDLNNVNPLLGPLADNGGGTPTQALLPGSPAIDAGDPITCPATDQRGISRPQGAACDIGAYELVSIAAPPAIPESDPLVLFSAGLSGLAAYVAVYLRRARRRAP
jgi:hypothetical protein